MLDTAQVPAPGPQPRNPLAEQTILGCEELGTRGIVESVSNNKKQEHLSITLSCQQGIAFNVNSCQGRPVPTRLRRRVSGAMVIEENLSAEPEVAELEWWAPVLSSSYAIP
jgi:hypothetical protein